MSKASLLHLPNEIILKILSDPLLPVDDLLPIASTCRRLNTLAINLFLASHRIDEPHKEFFIECPRGHWVHGPSTMYTPLDALAIAFDVTLIEKLWTLLRVDRPYCCKPRHKDYHRIANVIKRLSHIHHATITLSSSESSSSGAVGVWEHAVDVVLSALIEISCPELIVKGGTYPSIYFYAPPLQHSTQLSNSACQTASSFCHLYIQSPMLLYPPFPHWRYSLLTASVLTSPTINYIILDEQEWQIRFTWLNSVLHPSLQRFTLLNCHGLTNLSLSPLLQLITSLKHLTHLTLDRLAPYENPPSKSTLAINKLAALTIGQPKLPNLISLIVPADYIPHLCGFHTIPTLQSITILPRDPVSHHGVISFISSVLLLKPILTFPALKLHSNSDVTLDLHTADFTDEQLQRDLHALGVDASFTNYADSMLPRNESEQELGFMRRRGFQCYGCGTGLIMYDFPDMRRRRIELLGRWLALFVRLREVQFITKDEREGLEEEEAMALDWVVSGWCPNVERSKVGGVWWILQGSGQC